MNAEFMAALNQIATERGIGKEVLFEAVEAALINAYKRNYGATNNVRIEMNEDKGEIRIFSRKNVVNKRECDLLDGEVSLEGAQEINMDYQVGDVIEEEVTPSNFGRIAAQTARQMVIQKIKEASRDVICQEFDKRESEIVVGEVTRIGKGSPKGNITLNISIISENGITLNSEAMLLAQEQAPNENFEIGQRITVYILEIKRSSGGAQILVSRSHPGFVKRLFEREVPEIADGIVQIKSISREAGSRTKLAVGSLDSEVDAIGACVGLKRNRVGNVVDELHGEKIDIVNYSDDPKVYIANALSPSKVISVLINEEEKSARVVVPDYQLSLAIGKEGQNVRLAAKLTNWKIDIKSESQAATDEEYQEILKKNQEIAEVDVVEDEIDESMDALAAAYNMVMGKIEEETVEEEAGVEEEKSIEDMNEEELLAKLMLSMNRNTKKK
ncbi:MAG: transcription termination factor NusA [Filifactoraceae bacterium]